MANKLQVTDVYVDGEILRGTKLNTLVSGINNAFAMFSGVLADFGGDDRVIDDADSAVELKCVASGPADMNVNVGTGYAVISGMVVQNESSAVLTIVAPTVSNRYTICQISNEGVLSTKNSTEQAVPVEPSADADNIKLAAIYLPQNTTKIENSAGAFGYLIDRRTPMSLHPTTVIRHLSRYIPGELDTSGGPASDGYMYGAAASGMTFGQAITIIKVAINAFDVPTGDDVILTFRNVTQATDDAATLTDGSSFEETVLDLDFASADEMAIEVTQVGSDPGAPGAWIDLDIEYKLQ